MNEKRQKRFAEIDNLSPEMRKVVHEWGWTVVKNFIDCGVTKPKHIRHLVNLVLDETVRGGGSKQTAYSG
jgi:hypothetical protein